MTIERPDFFFDLACQERDRFSIDNDPIRVHRVWAIQVGGMPCRKSRIAGDFPFVRPGTHAVNQRLVSLTPHLPEFNLRNHFDFRRGSGRMEFLEDHAQNTRLTL
jgi:hypothetical protein